MPLKYFLLALVMLYNQDIVYSHILTPRDMPLASCMTMLPLAIHELCGIYGETTSDGAFDPPSMPHLMDRRYNIKAFIIKRCCTQPCTMPELLLAC